KMKRNLLLLFFFVIIVSLTGFNLALAQDPGVRDTCTVQRLQNVPANTQVVVNVDIANDEHLGTFVIPLVFPDTASTLDVKCDSVSFVGTRAASATLVTDASSIENSKHRLVVYAIWFIGDLAPGSGTVAKIYFTTGSTWNSSLSVPVDSQFYPPASEMVFVNTTGDSSWIPIFYKGALDVKEINTPTKPTVFSLAQNYPNPFNPKTMIRFALPKDSWVKLEVYNILGQKVKTLVDEKLEAGVKEVEWDGKDSKGLEVASGIYFYKIKANDFSDVKKMVMLK
ncbi:MAG TPA: T9SS type A sorting domain-containing protein, partial [Terriglobales bacterium]|nr:T9SS type A sorting domain-containing protein [Terriglobales bacterium]